MDSSSAAKIRLRANNNLASPVAMHLAPFLGLHNDFPIFFGVLPWALRGLIEVLFRLSTETLCGPFRRGTRKQAGAEKIDMDALGLQEFVDRMR